MSYIQVNIGRNVDNVPMSDELWDEFRENVGMGLVDAVIGSVKISDEHFEEIVAGVEYHFGTGTWDGGSEDSCHISIFSPAEIEPEYLGRLRQYLADTKRYYSQEAIALIVESELV